VYRMYIGSFGQHPFYVNEIQVADGSFSAMLVLKHTATLLGGGLGIEGFWRQHNYLFCSWQWRLD